MSNTTLKALLTLVLLASCASNSNQRIANTRFTQLQTQINALVGKSEDDVIASLGVPEGITEAGSFKVYRYKKVLGQAGGFRQNRNLFTGESLGTGYSTARELYDQYDLYFQGGLLQRAQINVQR